MSLLQFGLNGPAEPQPITSTDQRGLGIHYAAVADVVRSQYGDRA